MSEKSVGIPSVAERHLYYSVQNVVIGRGQGVWAYDTSGRRYLDCGAGTFNLSLGYSHQEVLDTVHEQMQQLIHCTSSFQNQPVNRLVRRLANVTPANLTRVHPKVSSGSTANEGAVKIAQYITGRRDVISLFRSHHGQTLMTLTISGETFRREPFPNLYPGALHVPGPYCYRCFYNQKPETCNFLCVERIHDFIEHSSSGEVACMILEPIQGSGGNIVPPTGYLDTVKKLCTEHGILLIFDEVQTGIGRTGKMFAADTFGVEPNIMTLGKGLGGTGFQVAAILSEEESATLPGHHHSFTFGANALACAAADKTLEIVSRPGFLDNVTAVGDYILARLRKMQQSFPFLGDVRGVGLMIGVEIVGPEKEPNVALTQAIAERAMNHELILRTSQYGYGNVIKIRPPLILTPDEAEFLCDRLESIFREVA